MPTVCELKVALKKLGITGYSGKTKSQLEDMLEEKGYAKLTKSQLKTLKKELEDKLLKLQNNKSYKGYGDPRELKISKELSKINRLMSSLSMTKS